METLKIGIAEYDRMKARTMSIALGEYKSVRDEPKIWFTSVESFAEVFSQRNRELLTLIARKQPDSIAELAEMSGWNKSNVSRTLKTMAQYGLVELEKGQRGSLAPRVPYDQVRIDMPLNPAPEQVA